MRLRWQVFKTSVNVSRACFMLTEHAQWGTHREDMAEHEGSLHFTHRYRSHFYDSRILRRKSLPASARW